MRTPRGGRFPRPRSAAARRKPHSAVIRRSVSPSLSNRTRSVSGGRAPSMFSLHSTARIAPPSIYSKNPVAYTSSHPETRYISKCTRGGFPPYSCTSANVGLDTSAERPNPAAIPLTNAVFPIPRPPYIATTVPGRSRTANSAPACSVSASEWVLHCTPGASFLSFIREE